MYWILQRLDNQQVLQLHQQFSWLNEYDWTALAQSTPIYTLTGAIDIQQGIKKAGRPIYLSGKHVWIKRADVKTLQAWADVAELSMMLVCPDGREFKVIFDRPALLNVQAVQDYRHIDHRDDDFFRLDLQFLTVA